MKKENYMIKKSNTVLANIIYRIIILTLLFFITGCGQANHKPIDNIKAIIVTVDGLSFVNTIARITIEKRNDYLQGNLKKIINSESIRPFHWSGDAADTTAILEPSGGGSLREFLRNNYKEAKNTKKAFIVISHSWGTLLTYLALSLEPQIKCDLYITLSSPLGTSSGLPDSAEKTVRDYTDAKLVEMSFAILGTSYPHTRVFYNFWANGDLISGSLFGKIPSAPNVHDVRVDDGISNVRDIKNCFFWHEFTTLGDEIIAGSIYFPYVAYLVSLGLFDSHPARNNIINQIVALIQSASS
jgi:pimeloyl-ACP methyl ester carboxylesterase